MVVVDENITTDSQYRSFGLSSVSTVSLDTKTRFSLCPYGQHRQFAPHVVWCLPTRRSNTTVAHQCDHIVTYSFQNRCSLHRTNKYHLQLSGAGERSFFVALGRLGSFALHACGIRREAKPSPSNRLQDKVRFVWLRWRTLLMVLVWTPPWRPTF